MRVLTTPGCLLLLLVGISSLASAQQNPIGTIVPGFGVEGFVRLRFPLESSLDDFQRRFGEKPILTSKRTDDPRWRILDYLRLGLRVYVDSRDVALQIVVLSSEVSIRDRIIVLRTSKGIQVGTLRKDVLGHSTHKPKSGRISSGEYLIYECIGFDISSETARVRAIVLWSPSIGCKT